MNPIQQPMGSAEHYILRVNYFSDVESMNHFLQLLYSCRGIDTDFLAIEDSANMGCTLGCYEGNTIPIVDINLPVIFPDSAIASGIIAHELIHATLLIARHQKYGSYDSSKEISIINIPESDAFRLELKGNDQLIPASRLCEEELFAEFVGSFTCHILNGYENAKNVYKGIQNGESDAIQWHKENSVGTEQYSEA